MALKILNSSAPYSEQRVTVSGKVLTLLFKFNSRNESWYIDILDSSGQNEILSGIKVMPNQNLTGRYKALLGDKIPDGNFWCLRAKKDFTALGFDNFGPDKTYELYWIRSDEEEGIGIDEFIQL